MEHFEKIYLLGVAQHLDAFTRQAAAEGETFHPSAHFTLLQCGLEAHASLQGSEVRLSLRAPPPLVPDPVLMGRILHAFFDGPFQIEHDPSHPACCVALGTVSLLTRKEQ